MKNNPTQRVSQKDIAFELGISRVTVTKALKNDPTIALKTRKKVQAKADEMGYVVDFIGRNLSMKKTFAIGIVLPKIDHSFFARTIEIMYNEAVKRGYHIIPMISFENTMKERSNIETLKSMRIDGLIIDVSMGFGSREDFELLNSLNIPVVHYDRHPLGYEGNFVSTNDYDASYQMTLRMLQMGYTEICYFANANKINISVERKLGYEKAMKEVDKKTRIVNVDLTRQSGYDAFMKLHNDGKLPRAIFAVNDSVCHGIYDAASELGIKIPQDVAIAGFGDVSISRLLQPALTSINIPIKEMASEAVNLLIDLVENGESKRSRVKVFDSEIIERQST